MRLGLSADWKPQGHLCRPHNAICIHLISHSNLFSGTIKQGVPSVVFEGGYHVEMANLVDTVTEGQKVVVSVRPEGLAESGRHGMRNHQLDLPGKYTNYFLRFGDGMVLEDQPSISTPRI